MSFFAKRYTEFHIGLNLYLKFTSSFYLSIGNKLVVAIWVEKTIFPNQH